MNNMFRGSTRLESRPSLTRFSVLVCHRRFGKTVLSVNRLIRAAQETGRSDWRGAYIAPLYRQAKTVVWDELKRYCGLGLDGCTVKFNETELRADFDNGARIRLFGANNPDSLRGMYLDGVVFDEVAQMPLRVWTEVIPACPVRSGRGGPCSSGRPGGKNALYEIWEKARLDPDWFAAMYRASEDRPLSIRTSWPPTGARCRPRNTSREFECSFTAAIRGAYFGQLLADADKEGRITEVALDPSMPVHTAWDLGMSDSTSIWFVQGPARRHVRYHRLLRGQWRGAGSLCQSSGPQRLQVRRSCGAPRYPGARVGYGQVASGGGPFVGGPVRHCAQHPHPGRASTRCAPSCPGVGSTHSVALPVSRPCATIGGPSMT